MGAVYRARNRDRVLEYNRQYRLLHRDDRLVYNLAWNRANRDKTDAATRKWREANPDKYRAQKLNHRNRRRNAPGSDYTTDAHVSWRRELYGFKCFYCGGSDETIDHRIPLAKGGTHFPANLVPACRSCNSKKQARTEREWRASEEVTP